MIFISDYLNIHRELSIFVTLTQDGVDHLKNMRNLHTLTFDDRQGETYHPHFNVVVAGEVPSLRNYGFPARNYGNQFIEDFGEKYPGKELLVSSMV